MANQTVTRTPNYYRDTNGNWNSSGVSSARLPMGVPPRSADYRVDLQQTSNVVSCSIKETLIPNGSWTGTGTVHCTAYGYNGSSRVWSATQSFQHDLQKQVEHTFSFSGLSGEVDSIVFVSDYDSELLIDDVITLVTAPTASYTYAPPALGLSVTPGSLYEGETIRCSITGDFSQTFAVRFYYGSTTLQSFSTSSTSFTQTANASWFEAAGVTGNSMRVNVSISDGLGRSASGSVTVNKHTALVPTINAPKGGSFDGAQEIEFAWSSSGDGTQTRAELQYSRDNVNWSTLTTVSGSGTQWTASAGQFPAGTVYWRLRLTNDRNLISNWVSASFTVTFSGASVTLNYPTSGSVNGGSDINFAWTITRGGGTITGTQMEYSTDGGSSWTSLVNSGSARTLTVVSGGYFKAGSLIWRVRARDSYSGWSSWKQATITINYGAALASLTAPTSGSHDGGQAITFAWTVTKGSGSVTQTQMAYSSDSGVTWTTILDKQGTVTSYDAPAGKFPSGSMIWRVRARDQYAGWSAWKQASITITYVAAVVTLTAPTSGTKDGGQAIPFAWTVTKGSGTIAGTQMDFSTDGGINWTSLVNSTGTVTSYNAPAGKFKAGSMLWRVRAKDNYAGWSAYKQATITISYTPATVTLTTPTSGSHDGAETITFGWSVTKGSGTVTGTQLQISTDDGLTWTSLINSAKQETTYTSTIAQFPAGKLLWRVRAKDSFSGYLDNWRQATITITYSATSQVVPVNSPTSGIISALVARTFTVRLDPSSPVHDPFQVSAATFFWRAGEIGEYTELEMTPDGNTASVTIPANTFPLGVIQWYATATDNTDRTTETAVYTITALQAEVQATPTSPINVVESGSRPIVFRWLFGSLDGSAQSRAELQYSLDGETWEALGSVQGAETSYTAPSGTFPGGTVYWRVRAYNAAGTEGPWSDPVTFVAYASAIVSGVTGNGRPFATISWQSIGQEAYEIEVDGTRYGPYFGAAVREYTLSEPLEDGSHTVRVRAQNRLSLWSEWETAEMSVVNVPQRTLYVGKTDGINVKLSYTGAVRAPVITEQPQDVQTTEDRDITFTVKFEPGPGQSIQWFYREIGTTEWTPNSSGSTIPSTAKSYGFRLAAGISSRFRNYEFRARLFSATGEVYSRIAAWRYAEPSMTSPLITGYFPAETGYFLIYRLGAFDRGRGKLIAKTYEKMYTDRVALGYYNYNIYQRIPDGYYNHGLLYFAHASVVCPMIAKLDGGDFLELALSENADREVRVTEGREVEWTQYAGTDYPSAEIGEGKSKAVALDVSARMADIDFRNEFTALLGEDVIVKTPDETVVIGPLESLDLRAPKSHRSWAFGVTQMEWEDFIDESQP